MQMCIDVNMFLYPDGKMNLFLCVFKCHLYMFPSFCLLAFLIFLIFLLFSHLAAGWDRDLCALADSCFVRMAKC